MNLWTQVDSNKRKSALLVFCFILLVVFLGWTISYIYDSPGIFYFAIIIALIQSLAGYFVGDQIVLATSGASEIKKKDNPMLWNLVENLAITAGLPMPKVYIIPDSAPNAFATGRDPKNASVAVTTGLLERLDKQEIEGVVAHEMSHVGNYDIRLMTVVAILVSVVALVSDIFLRAQWFGGLGRDRDNDNSQGGAIVAILGLVAIILAPLVATLVQLAISRKREFLADADGALLTRYPDGLADALEKISCYEAPVKKAGSATAHLYISNPLGGGDEPKKQSTLSKLFSTHPPIGERIRILRGMKVN